MATFYPVNTPLVNYFFYNFTTTAGGPNLPLDGGLIFFFDDNDHSVMLPTYSNVSDPNNPVVNTNPIELNVVGACPLFYLENRPYYVVVTDKNGDLDNPIWTFEHYNGSGGASGSSDLSVNYIPNGQFLLHHDLPATSDKAAGQIREAVTQIAYGGFTFEVPVGTTSTNFVTFEEYTDWAANPPSNPLFALRARCTFPDSGDDKKDICVMWPDVNRFASETETYTLGFNGLDNLAGSVPVGLYLIKNFGTGGDPQTEQLLTTFNLNSIATDFSFSFMFGSNEGASIGPDNDDFVKLALRPIVDQASDIKITNLQLRQGALNNPIYPETTERQDVSAGLGGGFPVPAYDDSQLNLYPVLTKTGWQYDDSRVGEVIALSYPTVPTGYTSADGSEFETVASFPDGVPCSRLQKKYMNVAANEYVPRYGTGKEFVTTYYINNTVPLQSLRIVNNKMGAVPNFTDGSSPSGFIFSNVYDGSVDTKSWGLIDSTPNHFYIWGKEVGALDDIGITANTSGFTVSVIRLGQPAIEPVLTRNIFSVTTIAATTLAGKYFEFNDVSNKYYVWYKVDGAGADPAPGGGAIGIQIDLLATYTAQEVANVTANAISGFKVTDASAPAGAAISASSFWLLNTQAKEFYVWYKKDGAGTDPAVPGKFPILVEILSTDTNIQVGEKTLLAINSKYFAIPDYRGMTLTGWDNGAGVDLDSAQRWSYYNNVLSGNFVGTNQFDENVQHNHLTEISTAVYGGSPGGELFFSPETLDFGFSDHVRNYNQGASASRPLNTYVNYVIKY
jgi:hypothetical protein